MAGVSEQVPRGLPSAQRYSIRVNGCSTERSVDSGTRRKYPDPIEDNSGRYLFLITIGIGTKPVKVNFWTRLFSGFSGVTSAVYRLPFESTDKWCSVPNCPVPEPHDPNPSRNSSVLRLKIMICAWLRFATYR